MTKTFLSQQLMASAKILAAMQKCNFDSVDALWSKMERIVKRRFVSPHIGNGLNKQDAVNLLEGLAFPFDENFPDYTPTALVMAAALRIPPCEIYGEPPQESLTGEFGIKSRSSRSELAARLEAVSSNSDYVDPFNAACQKQLQQRIAEVLRSLTAREERIIRLRFGIGSEPDRTLDEVGKDLSITRMRACQIEAKAMRKLKSPSRATGLVDFIID